LIKNKTAVESLRVILIGNYLPDQQESMIRFANLLDRGFGIAGVASEIWWPTIVFGKVFRTNNHGAGKWFGYIDKYLIFPLVLRLRIFGKKYYKGNVQFHICDHSNAPYLKYLPFHRTSITCHDVIAIRGGLGYTTFVEPASKTGKLLQKWILHHLSRAKSIAFVSQLTLDQFNELIVGKKSTIRNCKVINNSFNADFRQMDSAEAKAILTSSGIELRQPFLLHVGSDLPRKNRKLLLDMISGLPNESAVNICFAGESLGKELVTHMDELSLKPRVISVVKPNHNVLLALYSLCEAFVFPSFSEGFGWPIIEAQACGTPVLTSSIQPMLEVSGDAAIHCDPNRPDEFVKGFGLLKNEEFRQRIIRKGFDNCSRFTVDKMIKSYLNLYNGN
jgi:glycosyltransferase involved in cell wall biosynthesis